MKAYFLKFRRKFLKLLSHEISIETYTSLWNPATKCRKSWIAQYTLMKCGVGFQGNIKMKSKSLEVYFDYNNYKIERWEPKRIREWQEVIVNDKIHNKLYLDVGNDETNNEKGK